jgi:hypothetical protein
MKFRIQTIMKAIQIHFSIEIQISDPVLLEIHFFLSIRCNKKLSSQISLKSIVPRISSEFSSISTHRKFSEF